MQKTLKPKAIASKKRPKPESDEENVLGNSDSANDDSLLSHTPPSAKKQKTAPVMKKSAGTALQPVENESFGYDGTLDTKAKKAGNASEQYQKVRAKLAERKR